MFRAVTKAVLNCNQIFQSLAYKVLVGQKSLRALTGCTSKIKAFYMILG